ncbi:MAG: hypothetical protein AAGA95_13965, partial [Pseudomonadota bacterium]
HFDQVVDLAPGSQVLAGSEFCPNGMTLIGDNILTIQAHPEISDAVGATLYDARRSGLGDSVADQAIASLDQDRSDLLVGRWIQRFVEERI